MQLTSRPVALSATAVSIVAAATVGFWRYDTPTSSTPGTPPALAPAVPATKAKPAEALPISSGDTLTHVLLRAGIEPTVVNEIGQAVQPAFDVRGFRAGSELMLTRSGDGTVEQIDYLIDSDRKLTVLPAGDTFASAVTAIPSTIRVATVCGTLEGSLFESMQKAGEGPELALQIAEIFKWDVDFYKDPQPGDEFCLVTEKKEYANGQPSSYGRILSARYNNAGTPYEAYLFPDEHGKDAWFSRDGRSLQSAFLRSPIQFNARISSRFSPRRLHPVLRRYRPHLGTDYAVPVGTPVLAVADGRVVFSARSGGAGNLVRIRHAQGYETSYLHLSRRLVKQGQRVHQGQRIGLVGTTGLSTGPHLDLRVSRNGRFLDFEKLRAPKKLKVAADRMSEFHALRDDYAGMMSGASPSLMTRVSADSSPVMND